MSKPIILIEIRLELLEKLFGESQYNYKKKISNVKVITSCIIICNQICFKYLYVNINAEVPERTGKDADNTEKKKIIVSVVLSSSDVNILDNHRCSM